MGYVIFAKSRQSSNDPKAQDYALIFDPSTGTIYATSEGFANTVELLEPVVFYEKPRVTVSLGGVRWPKALDPQDGA